MTKGDDVPNDKKHGKFDVYILQAGREYRVRPAVTMIDRGRDNPQALKLDVRNLTDKSVVIVFPQGLLGPNQRVETLEPKGAAGHGDELHLPIDGQSKDAYPYSVAIATSEGLVPAKGESDPVIIIDP
jgi:hypothetical protein